MTLKTASTVTAVNAWGPTGLLARQTTNPTTGTSASTYYAWDGLGNAAQTLNSVNANVVEADSYPVISNGCQF